MTALTYNFRRPFLNNTRGSVVSVSSVRNTTSAGAIEYVVHPHTGNLVQIDPDQAWFWSEEWQAAERQVDAELASGDYEEFDSIEDLIANL